MVEKQQRKQRQMWHLKQPLWRPGQGKQQKKSPEATVPKQGPNAQKCASDLKNKASGLGPAFGVSKPQRRFPILWIRTLSQ